MEHYWFKIRNDKKRLSIPVLQMYSQLSQWILKLMKIVVFNEVFAENKIFSLQFFCFYCLNLICHYFSVTFIGNFKCWGLPSDILIFRSIQSILTEIEYVFYFICGTNIFSLLCAWNAHPISHIKLYNAESVFVRYFSFFIFILGNWSF